MRTLADRIQSSSRTKFLDEEGIWYTLDNAGVIMPAVSDSIGTSYFRYEALLDHEPDRGLLHKALLAMAARFPYFNVQLRRGFFWYYFEPCQEPLAVLEEDFFPCQSININTPGTRMFRVSAAGTRVACEFSHALTDGSGGASFIKSLITEYFRLRGVEAGAALGEGAFADIAAPDSRPALEEYEDAYRRYCVKGLPYPRPGEGAWHLERRRIPKGQYRVTGASLALDALLAESKRRGVSLTEFLSAVYIECLQELWLSSARRPARGLIALEIPVNMRKWFPSRTNRNFSLFVVLTQHMRLGRRSFDDILARAHHQMRIENDPQSIAMQISRNVASMTNMYVRLAPLFVKILAGRIVFNLYGDDMLSGFISNIGPMRMPPGPAAHITGWNFIPAPSKNIMTNAAALSWGNDLRINFGSLCHSSELERLFFTRLRRMGFHVKMEHRDAYTKGF